MNKVNAISGRMETLSPAQLVCWYGRLEKMEARVNHILRVRSIYKGRYERLFSSSPRRAMAMMVSGAVIMTGFLLNDYFDESFWLMLGGGGGVALYFFISVFSSLPKNDREYLISVVESGRLPAGSIVSGLHFSPESSTEMVGSQIREAIRQEKNSIEMIPGFCSTHQRKKE